MQNISYSSILKQAFIHIKKNPFLLVFGFFLSGILGNLINVAIYEDPETNTIYFFGQHEDIVSRLIEQYPSLILGFVIIMILFIVFLIIVHIISFAGIAISNHLLVQGQPTSLKQAITDAKTHFWQLLGINVLLFIATILAVTLLLIPFVIGINITSPVLIGLGIVAMIFGIIGISVALILTSKYAQYYQALNNLSPKESILQGWNLLKKRLGISLLFGLLIFGINFAFWIAFIVVAGIIGGICFAIASLSGIAFEGVSLFVAIALAIAIFGAIFTAITTYNHTLWVLFFEQIAKQDAVSETTQTQETTAHSNTQTKTLSSELA